MNGRTTSCILKFFSMMIALSCVFAVPRGLAFPAEESLNGNAEPIPYPFTINKSQQEMLPPLEQVDKPKNCFHFFVSRNMSSLLSDATKMLRQVRDRREKEWILTFIYRIKSLAEHLRSHPESRNYDCLPNDGELKKRPQLFNDHVRIPQPELYFVDDVPAPQSRGTITPSPSSKGEQEFSSSEEGPQTSGGENKQNEDNQASHQSPTTHGEEQSSLNIPPNDETETDHSTEEQTEDKPQSGKAVKESSEDNLHQAQPNSVQSTPDADLSVAQNAQADDDNNAVPMEENKRSYGYDDNAIVISSTPPCDSTTDCNDRIFRRQQTPGRQVSSDDYSLDSKQDDSLLQTIHARQQEEEEERHQYEALKERIRKALLEEMAPEIKKLRTVGGSEEDLINLWKLSEGDVEKPSERYQEVDFDYEETGAAAGDLNSNDRIPPSDRTVAPSLGEVKNSKQHTRNVNYEPYDDSDVLVQQLFEVRFNEPPSKTTKSLGDQNEEYLITSTHIPY